VKIREWLSAHIKADSGAIYDRVIARNGFAAFRKEFPKGRLTWIIARQPLRFNPSDPPPPASVAAEFESEQAAIRALERWASAPQPPNGFRKPKTPLARPKSPNRRSRKVGAQQLHFDPQ
jgi:hypothetical protein